MKTDRASMAWSLEARVPFMDTVVANFAFSLPVRHKVRGLSKKRLLRQAVEPLLPREVVHGRKRGFSIPAAAWLRGELEPFARETLSPETLRRQGFLAARRRSTRVLDDHVAGRARPLAPALGAARVHALARAPRRRHPPRRAARAAWSREGLDRHDGERAPARLPAARRAAARAGPRGRDHGARLRADAAADRVARHDGDGDRPPRRPLARSARRGRCSSRLQRAAHVGAGRATSTSRSRTARTS